MNLTPNQVFWILLAIDAIAGLCIFIGRNSIKAWIEKGIQHRFDVRLEELRKDHQEKLEKLRSDLRDREAELAALRESVLSGRANRRVQIDKRRLEAIERVWNAVITFSPFKFHAETIASLNLDRAEKEAATNPQFKELFKMIADSAPGGKLPDNPAKLEQPYVAPLIWAYLSAYLAIVSSAWTTIKMLGFGLEGLRQFRKKGYMENLLKSVLPHRAAAIDGSTDESYFSFLEEIEKLLLAELTKALDGAESDAEDLARSAEIMKWAKQASIEDAKEAIGPGTK